RATLPQVMGFSSTAGGGVTGTILTPETQYNVAAGRSSFIVDHVGGLTKEHERALNAAEAAGSTAVWVAIDGQIAGIISLQDQSVFWPGSGPKTSSRRSKSFRQPVKRWPWSATASMMPLPWRKPTSGLRWARALMWPARPPILRSWVRR